MATKLLMGNKELLRSKVMEMVVAKKLTLREASDRLLICYRQAKRILARFRGQGDAGLIHGLQGKPSSNQFDAPFRETAINLITTQYADFGPTLAAEKLAERHDIHLDHETLRRWMIAADLWKAKRRGVHHRSRREPKAQFGELVQFDGSHHDWFEGRRDRCCLMNMVDDATGDTLAIMNEQETTIAAMDLLRLWIEKYDIPQAVYCDRKNAFVIDREPTIAEQLAGMVPKSPFQIACEKLGIEVIVAHSPQAKGRVERNHAVYQDRFVKELRLRSISTITEANQYLHDEYLPAINAKFARKPRDSADGHVPLVTPIDLNEIFCFEERRVVSKDFVVQFERRLFQITSRNVPRPRPNDRVLVRRRLDGSIGIYWNQQLLDVVEIQLPTRKELRPRLSA
jgi:hypothetical protein